MAYQTSSSGSSGEERSRSGKSNYRNSRSSRTTSVTTLYSSDSHSSENEDEKISKTTNQNNLTSENETIFKRKKHHEATDSYGRIVDRHCRKRSHSRSRSISPDRGNKSQKCSRSGALFEPYSQQTCTKSEKSRLETETRRSIIKDDALETNKRRTSSQSPNIALPSYYNRKMINPKKYADQIRKRKLLWGNNKVKKDADDVGGSPKQQVGNFWQKASFSDDENGETTAKFKRLMGIRNANEDGSSQMKVQENDIIEKQKEIFDSMESQYEAARLATHTLRGVGLGFGTFPSHPH